MAPEQWRSESVDERADIYAIGSILYELLTSDLPFAAQTNADFRHHHLRTLIPSIVGRRQTTLSTALIKDLDTLLARCLAKRREERFLHVNELLAALIDVYRLHLGTSPRNVIVTEDFTAAELNNRGYTYSELQCYPEALADYTQAIAFYMHAIELDPMLAIVSTNIGRVLGNQGKLHKA